jgi:hypothetical protein
MTNPEIPQHNQAESLPLNQLNQDIFIISTALLHDGSPNHELPEALVPYAYEKDFKDVGYPSVDYDGSLKFPKGESWAQATGVIALDWQDPQSKFHRISLVTVDSPDPTIYLIEQVADEDGVIPRETAVCTLPFEGWGGQLKGTRETNVQNKNLVPDLNALDPNGLLRTMGGLTDLWIACVDRDGSQSIGGPEAREKLIERLNARAPKPDRVPVKPQLF